MEHLHAIVDLCAMTLNIEYSYVHIISGEDFPTCAANTIKKFFDGSDLIYCECTPAKRGISKRSRFFNYYWPYTKFHLNYKNKFVRYLSLMCVAVQVAMPVFNRKKLGEFEDVYGGLIWGSYPRDVIVYCLDYLNKNLAYWKQLETCKIPEELCFPTIIMNSQYKNKVAKDRKRYENWTRGNGWGPVYLELSDIEEIDKKRALFVRKIKNNSPLMLELKKRQQI